jgi:hypothetical protein
VFSKRTRQVLIGGLVDLGERADIKQTRAYCQFLFLTLTENTMSQPMFNPALLGEAVQKILGDSLIIRPLQLDDYEKGFMTNTTKLASSS